MVEILLPNGNCYVMGNPTRLHEEYVNVGGKTKHISITASNTESLEGINTIDIGNMGLMVKLGCLSFVQVKEVLVACFKKSKLNFLDNNPFSFDFDILTDEKELKNRKTPYMFVGENKHPDIFSQTPMGYGICIDDDDDDDEDDWIDEDDEE